MDGFFAGHRQSERLKCCDSHGTRLTAPNRDDFELIRGFRKFGLEGRKVSQVKLHKARETRIRGVGFVNSHP